MANFIHRFLNPHCTHCIEEREESKYCSSCETLQRENAFLREENRRLLDRLLKEPEPEKVNEDTSNLKPILPRHVPWAIKRQMLEQEDREKAAAMKRNQEATTIKDERVDKLEKELGVEGA